jgi:hypothetical protein
METRRQQRMLIWSLLERNCTVCRNNVLVDLGIFLLEIQPTIPILPYVKSPDLIKKKIIPIAHRVLRIYPAVSRAYSIRIGVDGKFGYYRQ